MSPAVPGDRRAGDSGLLRQFSLRRDAERVRAEARAFGVRALRLAEADGEAARLAAYRDVPAEVLQALTLKEFAGQLPEIGQLTVTPDLVTTLLQRLTRGAPS